MADGHRRYAVFCSGSGIMNIRKKMNVLLFPDIWRGLLVSLRYALGIGNAQKIRSSVKSSVRLPVVDFDKCVGCKLCAKICPSEAVSIKTVFQEQAKPVVDISLSEEKCVSCGLCAESCPENAITLERK